MLLRCMIKRDGETTVTRGGVNYTFRENAQGHAVCEVQNDDHAKVLLHMGPRFYRPYGEQAVMHAKALKMVLETTVIDEDDDGEVFEETVAIVEGGPDDDEPTETVEPAERVEPVAEQPEPAAEASIDASPGAVNLFDGPGQAVSDAAEPAAVAEPGDFVEAVEEAGAVEVPGEPQGDTLVLEEAARLIDQGMTKTSAVDSLREKFGLTVAAAREAVNAAAVPVGEDN